MKALVCSTLGTPDKLEIRDMPSTPLGKGQVRISVKAAALNFPDGLIIQGLYQFKPELPFVPGGEAAGDVLEVGEGVTAFTPGDRVLTVCGIGAFAEEVVVDQANVVAIPQAVEYQAAAALMMTYGTSYHALKQRAQLKAGETVLVLGAAGGVGLSAVELAKAMGAKVIAAASSQEKLDLAARYGADELINYSEGDFKQQLKELVGRKGIDVVVDPVGGDYFEAAFRNMAWNGRALVIGFTAGNIPALPLNLPLLKGASVVGVFWGQFRAMEPKVDQQNNQEMLQLCVEGKINPHISEVYSLDNAQEAFEVVMGRKATGKLIIEP